MVRNEWTNIQTKIVVLIVQLSECAEGTNQFVLKHKAAMLMHSGSNFESLDLHVPHIHHANTQKCHTTMTSYSYSSERGVSTDMEEGAEGDLRPCHQILGLRLSLSVFWASEA